MLWDRQLCCFAGLALPGRLVQQQLTLKPTNQPTNHISRAFCQLGTQPIIIHTLITAWNKLPTMYINAKSMLDLILIACPSAQTSTLSQRSFLPSLPQICCITDKVR
jgi:hypothetical protein